VLVHLDYIWVDGFERPSIRSKTKARMLKPDENGEIQLDIPEWNFDGSSTGQADTGNSERILKPKSMYQIADNHYVTLCEVCMPDAERTPHPTNYRAKLREVLEHTEGTKEMWVGFEQEYFFTSGGKNVFWPDTGEPVKDSRYYCSSGGSVKFRKLVREHASFCNQVGVRVVGYNAEVSPGQWEYQCFAEDPITASDSLWVSRYILELMTEDVELGIDWSPKPHPGWNGSGCHTNFSTKRMREEGGEEEFHRIISNMEARHDQSISEYGKDNGLRLTGGFETASLNHFTYGVASRDTSVRIPNLVIENNWKGYLEDRRPSSGCDPYRVALQLCNFVKQ
jgi:glutamine synthetase